MPPPGGALEPAHRKQAKEHEPRQHLQRRWRTDAPLRIDRQQAHRPRALDEVEGEARGAQRDARPDAAHRNFGPVDGVVDLKPDRDDTQDKRHGEKGRGCLDIRRLNPAAPPPGMEQDHEGKHGHRGLAKHCHDKKAERHKIVARPTMHVVIDPRARGQKKRRQRKRVLQFRDPRHRLDLHRMNRKKKTSHPREPEAEPGQQSPHEQCAQEMQENINEMIAGRVISPKPPLQPLDSGPERIKIDEASRLRPDFPPAGRIMIERIVPDQLLVVPKPVTVDHGQIDPHDHRRYHGHSKQDGLPADFDCRRDRRPGFAHIDFRRGWQRQPSLRPGASCHAMPMMKAGSVRHHGASSNSIFMPS